MGTLIPPRGAPEPLHSLLYRYFFFDWLFSGPQGRPYPPRAIPTYPRGNGNGRYSSR